MTNPVRILTGDVLARLADIPDNSVQCCVTSPPYYGLRDYGVDGQIGLEPTPEAFIAKMVAVFAEVRRVLREDGTLWLNLGSSYASGGTSPSQSRSDARSCGTDGTEPHGSQGAGRACPCCGGELLDGSLIRRDYIARTSQQPSRSQPRPSRKGRDTEQTDSASASPNASFPDALDPTTPASSPRALDACGLSETASADQSGEQTSPCSSTAFSRNSVCMNDTEKRDRPSTSGTSGMGFFCKACGYCTTMLPAFKAKDLINMPFLVAEALRADGWYLRSVIVWAKKSPMPESVRDRPTSSWEPIFLMSKSSTYFYDADAVKEKTQDEQYATVGKMRPTAEGGPGFEIRGGLHKQEGGRPTRNLRNVWHLGPEPFNGWTYDFSAADYVDGRGIPRKWSPDCPKHERDGRLRQENPVGVSCDAQAADPSLNSGRTGGNHEEAPPSEPLPTDGCSTQQLTDTPSGADQESTSSSRTTCESGSEELGTSNRNCGTPEEPSPSTTGLTSPPCSSAATPHSSGNRKTAHVPEISLRDTDAAETACGKSRTQPQPMFDARGQHKCESSTSKDASDLSEKTSSSTTGISVSSTNGKCLCRESKVDHFATFPTEIPRRAILAGTSEKGCCPECGAGWVRVVESTGGPPKGDHRKNAGFETTAYNDGAHPTGMVTGGALASVYAKYGYPVKTTTGWQPACTCQPHAPQPCLVLDPFLGSGTTLAVARQLGRHGVGIELNPEYVKLAEDRIGKAEKPHTYASKREDDSPLFVGAPK